MTDLSLPIEGLDPLNPQAGLQLPAQFQPQALPVMGLDPLDPQAGLPQPQQEPAPVVSQGWTVFKDFARRKREQEDASFMRAFQVATERNPDLAADINKLSTELGVPPDVVANDITWAKRLSAREHAKRMLAAEVDPVLRRQMTDPEFAAIAWDDLSNLSAWGRIKGNWDAGQFEVERGRLGIKLMAKTATQQDIERLAQVDDALQSLPSGDSWIGGPARMFGQMYQTLPNAALMGTGTMLTAAALGGGAGPQAAITLPAAFAFGMASGVMIQAFQIEGGNAYLDYKRNGFDEGTAINAARTVGAVNAMLEVTGFSLLTSPVKGFIKDRLRKGVAERMFRMTPGAATLRALKESSAATFGEIGTEVLQEASNMIGEEVSRYASETLTSKVQGGFSGEFDAVGGGRIKIDGRGQMTVSADLYSRVMGVRTSDAKADVVLDLESRRQFMERYDESAPLASAISSGEFLDRLIDTAWFTLKGVWLPGVSGPALRLIGDRQRIHNATLSQKVLEAAETNAGEAKAQARNADVYTQFLASSLKDKRAETLYITKAKLREKMEAAGVDYNQLEREFPKLAAQLREDDGINEDIEIPLAEWNGYKMFETSLGQMLKEDLRVGDKDAMSFAESVKVAPEIEARVEEIRKQTLQDEAARSVFDAEASAIEKRTITEIRAANASITGSQARVNAHIHRRIVETLALRTGKTPAQFEEAYGRMTTIPGLTRVEQDLSQFAGPKAKGAPRTAMRQALALLEGGANAEQVFAETGWSVGADGKLRWEISDDAAVLKVSEVSAIPQGGTLADILEHPGLLKAYPKLAATKIVVDPQMGRGAGYMEGGPDGMFRDKPGTIYIGRDVDSEDLLSAVLHEVQHAIQFTEGFGEGGAPGGGVTRDDYRRISGEVEARNTQSRQEMSKKERRASDPATTEDTPRNAQTVIIGGRPFVMSAEEGDVTFAQGKGAAPVPPTQFKMTPELRKKITKLKKEVPGIAPLLKFLQPDELAVLVSGQGGRAETLVKLVKQMPSAAEMAEVALSGVAKRGWYERSAAALRTVFGEDTERFVALLAALSPQTSVQANLINTLKTWRNWVAAGRPTSKSAILKVLAISVQGSGTEKSVLKAWRNNSYTALQATDPKGVVLSGPKVNSFLLNLLGESIEVTNDAWMANFGFVSQELFARDNSVPLPGKGAGYLAMSVVVRRAAAQLGWTPAEIQETVWSWSKALYEKAEKQKRTAADVLTKGDLTHADINSVPDFDILFREPEYAAELVASGYADQLAQLHSIPAPATAGSVFTGDTTKLLKAAERLDRLADERKRLKTRHEILVNLSASTMSIPGLAKLTAEAAAGDASAATLLREITIDSLRYLTKAAKSAIVSYTPSTGLYQGDVEASVGLSVSFLEGDREKMVRALRQFAQNFNQDQFHIRGELGTARGKVGKVYADGSFNTRGYRFLLKSPLTPEEVTAIIEESGLVGATFTDEHIDIYYAGDPTNAQAIEEFYTAAKRVKQSLGSRSSGMGKGTGRLWVYGNGAGAISYGSIDGRVQAAKDDQEVTTARRVASRLANREVKGAPQADKIAEPQRALQARIAGAYEAADLNNLSDPNVRRAYEELAAEVLDQFDSLPIKVEIWTKKGEPYKGEKMSEKMRKDVLVNNRLFIFATNTSQFGPEGVVYDNHPLLADSGRKDANGTPLVFNDLLRAVHDYYAHTITPVGFGPKGEEAAWRNHMEMTRSPWARWALTSETRGQNSWVNFREEVEGKPLSGRPFAEQKVDLLPLEFVATGDVDVDANLAELPGSEDLLFQDRDSDRGSFDPNTFVVKLFKGADVSTFFHEGAHYYLEVLLNIARSGTAPQSVLDDLNALAEWGGMDGWEDLATTTLEGRRKLHEMFAYNFEKYLSEGVVPSTDRKVLGVFRTIRRWLTQVYKDVTRMPETLFRIEFGEDLPEINDGVRAVMDRLLETQEAIDYARKVRSVSALFEIAEDATVLQALTPEQRQTLRELVIDADYEAEEKLGAVMLRQLRYLKNFRGKFMQEVQSQTRAARRRIHDEVLAEKSGERVHRLQHFLNTGEFLNSQGAPEPTADFPRRIHEVDGEGLPAKWVSRTGASADVLAKVFGYQSGPDMLDDLRTAPTLSEAVETRTDRRMAVEHEDLVDEKIVEERLVEAMSGPVFQKLIAEQMRIFDRSLPNARLQQAAARAVAQRLIGNMVAGELRPLTYSLAAGRAQRAASEARREGDLPRYRAELRRALFQNALAEEAAKTQDELRKGERRQQKRFQRPDEKVAKQKRLVPVFKAARLILSRYGVVTPPAESIGNPQFDPFAPLAEDDPLRLELQAIVDAESADARPFKTLTVDELRELFELGDSLWFRSKRDKQVLMDGERVELEGIIENMIAHLRAQTPAERAISGSLSKGEKRGRWVRRQLAQFKRMEFALRALDSGAPGVFTRAIWRRAKDAANQMRLDETRYLRRVQKLVDKLDLSGGEIKAAGLVLTDGGSKDHVFGRGEVSGKAELIGALLHMGNLSNLFKLVKGYNWGAMDAEQNVDTTRWFKFVQEQIDAGVLTKEDFDFVQAIWDLNEELKPRAQQAHYEITGYTFKEIRAQAFAFNFPNKGIVEYRGGYVPAATDKDQVVDARLNSHDDLLNFQRKMPTVPRGMTKNRAALYARELDLNPLRVAQHIHSVLLFSHMAPALKDIRRIVEHQDFKNAIDQVDPLFREEVLRPWIETLASQRTTMAAKDTWGFLNSFRSRAGQAVMFFNVKNTLQNTSGIALAMTLVKPRYVMHSLADVLRDREGAMQRVKNMSPYMRDRFENSDIYEVRDRFEALVTNRGPVGDVQEWFRKNAYWLQRLTQEPIDTAVWLAAYDQAIVEQGAAVAGEHAHVEAVQRADAAVRQTQTSNNPEDLSTAEKGSAWMKLFLQFRGWFISYGNLMATERSIRARDPNRTGSLAALYFIGVFATLVSAELIDALVDGDEIDKDEDGAVWDDWAWRALMTHVSAITGAVPLWGDAGMVAFSTLFDPKNYGARMPEPPTIGALRQGLEAIRDGDVSQGRKLRSVLSFISLLSGVPVNRLLGPAVAGYELASGQADTEGQFGPVVEIPRAIITGKTQKAR